MRTSIHCLFTTMDGRPHGFATLCIQEDEREWQFLLLSVLVLARAYRLEHACRLVQFGCDGDECCACAHCMEHAQQYAHYLIWKKRWEKKIIEKEIQQ